MAYWPSMTGSLPGTNQARRDDSELVRAARQGDKRAFQELVVAYDHIVLRLALDLTHSEEDAQRIYEQVFLRAFTTLPTAKVETSLFIWIYRLAASCCLENLRGSRYKTTTAFAGLSLRERLVFVLVQYGGLRISTVAEILQLSEEVVKDALTRAVYKLRILKDASLQVTDAPTRVHARQG